MLDGWADNCVCVCARARPRFWRTQVLVIAAAAFGGGPLSLWTASKCAAGPRPRSAAAGRINSVCTCACGVAAAEAGEVTEVRSIADYGCGSAANLIMLIILITIAGTPWRSSPARGRSCRSCRARARRAVVIAAAAAVPFRARSSARWLSRRRPRLAQLLKSTSRHQRRLESKKFSCSSLGCSRSRPTSPSASL